MTRSGSLLPSSLLGGRLLGDATAAGQPTSSPSTGYRLGSPGRPAKVPTLLIAVFDNSGSVICPAGTDPLANRFGEVARALSVVARGGSDRELGAVVHFDTPSSGEVGPTPLTKRGMAKLRRGLVVPADGAGSSELAPSLERSVEMAAAYPDYAATLVVLSDFMLFDADPGQVLSDLAAFPGDVHAVVLGAQLPAGVLDARVTVTKVGRGDRPGAVARAMFSSLITHRSGSRLDSGGGEPSSRVSWIPQRSRRWSRLSSDDPR